ncbi:hypothetical protein TNCV_2916381 [Trichonephila clavipes]|nr:hypothetical protein TNCV_2916381 [Trichonephila clavipes]
MPDDSQKGTAVQSHWDSEAWKTKSEIGRLSGIRLWEYKRENSKNKSKQEIIMEEPSKEGPSPRGAVLPDMISSINITLLCHATNLHNIRS